MQMGDEPRYFAAVPCANFIYNLLDHNDGTFWYIFEGEVKEVWIDDPKRRIVILGDELDDIYIEGWTILDEEEDYPEQVLFKPCDIHEKVFTSREEAERHL